MTAPKTPEPNNSNNGKAEKKRAQPGDFERQVEQIRKDITTVRENLAAAEKALEGTELSTEEEQLSNVELQDLKEE